MSGKNIRDVRHECDAYLEKLSISALKSKDTETIVTVKASDDVVTIYQALQSKQISSVPVVDEKGDVCGVVDYLDLLCWLAETMPDSMSIALFMSKDHISKAGISHVKAQALIDNSGKDQFVPIYFDKLHTLLAEFNKYHRLVGMSSSESGKIDMIVSQSAVMKFLFALIEGSDAAAEPLRSVSKLTLAELYYVGEDKVVAIQSTDSLAQAIQTLAKEKLYAAPVVDAKTGALLYNFSAADLKSLYKDDSTFNVFKMTIADWMKKINASPAVVVTGDKSIGDVMKIMVRDPTGRVIHRVYIVSPETRKPSRVITMTDVLNVFVFNDFYPHHK